MYTVCYSAFVKYPIIMKEKIDELDILEFANLSLIDGSAIYKVKYRGGEIPCGFEELVPIQINI